MNFKHFFKGVTNNKSYYNNESDSSPHKSFDLCLAELKKQNKTIAFFDASGILYNVFPFDSSKDLYENRGTAYEAEYLVIGEKIYNTLNPEDIKNIPIPDFIFHGNITFGLEYILRMHRNRTDNHDIEVAVAEKTIELMQNCKFNYSITDYFLPLQELMSVGEFKRADKLYEILKNKLDIDCKNRSLNRLNGNMFNPNNDLVVASGHECTCEICAKYQCRVYSLSGKDKRFPKLPDFVYKYGSFHEGCRHTFFPFEYGISPFYIIKNGKSVLTDAIEYSNRPFEDTRSNEEKAAYLKRIKDNYANANYESIREIQYKRYIQKQEYNLIVEKLPEIAPKSYQGYARMKTMNTANYKKILQKMEEKGYTLK